MDKLSEFWDKVQEFVSYIGAPWDLDSAKHRWLELGGPVAARASESDRSQSTVDTEWKGQAADRYAMSLGPQGKALAGVQGKLDLGHRPRSARSPAPSTSSTARSPSRSAR